MKKKVRVDFSAHCSIVVAVEESDDYLDQAAQLAEKYVDGNPSINPDWEIDDDGVDDAEEDAEVDVEQRNS